MKRLFTFLVAVAIAVTVWAQSPQKMSYQAVIRDASNKLVVNRTVGMRISILQGSASGTAIYTETQKPGTNANGLVSIEIGTQPASGSINWALGPYFIKTETDPEGGTNYTITGASQLLSVPYALYAENGGTPGPQGLKGDKGDQGSRGIQGPAGADGLTTSVNGVTQVAGAITLTKSNIGLENVDNTSDTNKPISSPTQAALNLKVDKVTGKGLSTEDYTTVEKTKLADIIGTNTGDQDLSGLATTTSVTTGLAAKVDVVAGKGLSTEDYTTAEKTKLAAVTGTNTGDQDLSGLATTTAVNSGLNLKVDKEAGKGLSTEDYTTTEKTKLAAITGTNTGDQDLSGLATTTSVTTGLAAKVDVVAGKGLSTEDYTTVEKTKLADIIGTNTGDQDLSGLATTTSVTTGLAAKVDVVAGKGLSTEDYTTAEKTKLADIIGTNTGDQDLSALATTASVTTGLAAKVDVVAGKGLSTEDYTTAEKTKLADIIGTNTGDQDLSALATTTSVTTGLATKVDVETGKGLSTEDYTTAEKTKLADIIGTNTGDQDLSALATTASVTTGLAVKVDVVAGKGLSTNDYTTAEQTKLNGIATGAEVNVNADWDATSGDGQILNKPTIPAAADGSETKVNAGANVTVTGAGTTANPYVVNATGATAHAIGDSYQGGIIFWLDATGQHGLIVATSDQSSGIHWYNGTNRTTGTSGDGLYAGAMNTAMIVASQMNDNQSGSFAAKLCADYGGSDLVPEGDWYLPSLYEWKLLAAQTYILPRLFEAVYWTSTEVNGSSALAYPVGSASGSDNSKSLSWAVTAIRAF